MMYLITGTPGAGKTLHAVEQFLEWKKKDHDDVEDPAQRRAFFTCNLEGVKIPGAGVLPVERFMEWPDLLPDGAVLLLDEGQDVFRPDAGRVPPPYITSLEKHRHKGVDFIITTQDPSFVHTHIRKLANVHRHVVPMTNNSAQIFEWRETNEKPEFRREGAAMRIWMYPPKLYGLYKSATLHTKKLKWPPWLKKLVVLGVVLVAVLVYVFQAFHNLSEASKPVASETSTTDAKTAKPASIKTAGDYVAQFMPRVRSMPWSAPAYDGRKPQSDPELYCVTIKTEDSEHCQCYTEQATRYEVDAKTCKHIAEWGNYNPFRKPIAEPQQVQQQKQQAQDQPAAPPPFDADGVPSPAVGSNYAPPGTLPWNADYFGGGKGGR